MKKYENIIVFDDSCVLCNASVRLIFENVKDNKFYFTHFNSDYFNSVLRESYNLESSDSVILIEGDKVFYKSEAAFRISKDFRFPLKALSYFRFLPKFLTDFCYDLIANNRYKIFGRTDSCVFDPELTKRILD